ncbi:MAG: condensation domain-containing protein, partial [Nostoc sp.]
MDKKSSNLSPAKKALLEKWKGGEFQADIIPKRQSSNNIPLSFSQQRLWFIDQLYHGSSFYNIPSAFHLTGLLNITALQQSLNEILRRHEVWRTTFALVNGEPVQEIAPQLTWDLHIINLEHLSGRDWEGEIKQLAALEAKKPFNLAKGLLVRATLLRLGEEEHVFLLTMHHIITDGWSIGVFLQELATLYAAFSTNQPSPLPEL